MYVMAEMLHPLLDARSDAGQTLRARGSRIAARLLGGMSEWLKETGCKPVGSAYAGSNPAPPIKQASIGLALSGDRRETRWSTLGHGVDSRRMSESANAELARKVLAGTNRVAEVGGFDAWLDFFSEEIVWAAPEDAPARG